VLACCALCAHRTGDLAELYGNRQLVPNLARLMVDQGVETVVVPSTNARIVQEAAQAIGQAWHLARHVPLAHDQRQVDAAGQVQTRQKESRLTNAAQPFSGKPHQRRPSPLLAASGGLAVGVTVDTAGQGVSVVGAGTVGATEGTPHT
jgi:hypothetical protein